MTSWRIEEVRGETAGSWWRLVALILLGLALFLGTLFWVIVSACPVNLFDKTLKKYPELSGSIIYYYLGYFVPSQAVTGRHDFPFGAQQADVLCTIEDDTLIVCSYAPLDTHLTKSQVNEMTSYETSYFYKHKPFTNSFVRIEEITDWHSITYFLDYDLSRQQFLRWNPRDDKLLLLTRDFRVVKDLTPYLGTKEIENSIDGLRFIKGGVALQQSGFLKLYSLEGDSLVATNRDFRSTSLEAVSHSGGLAIFSQRGQDEAIPFLLDVTTGAVKELSFKQEFNSACFSPNDSLIAYSRVTNNLTDDVTLYLYDLNSGEHFKTGVHNAAGIDVWVESEPPDANRQSQGDRPR